MIDEAIETTPVGETTRGFIPIGRSPNGASIQIPYVVHRGSAEGPVLWLNALIHGDEVNGAMTVLKTLETVRGIEVIGTVVATPLAHPPAFQFRQKLSPVDGLDLGASFPGRPDGLLTQRIAHHLFDVIVRYANYVIDFHTVGSHYKSIIYTVFRQFPGLEVEFNRKVRDMALSFNACMNCRIDVGRAAGELAGTASGSLDANCILAGIPAFMAEIGSGGRVDELLIDQAVQNVLGTMYHLGMVDKQHDVEVGEQVIITKRRFLYSDNAGLFIPSASAGAALKRNALIGQIVTFDREEPISIQADVDALLLVSRENAIVGVGDRVAIIGEEWTEVEPGY